MWGLKQRCSLQQGGKQTYAWRKQKGIPLSAPVSHGSVCAHSQAGPSLQLGATPILDGLATQYSFPFPVTPSPRTGNPLELPHLPMSPPAQPNPCPTRLHVWGAPFPHTWEPPSPHLATLVPTPETYTWESPFHTRKPPSLYFGHPPFSPHTWEHLAESGPLNEEVGNVAEAGNTMRVAADCNRKGGRTRRG